jgi:hypothetical protein
MNWDDIKDTIAKAAPLAGTLIGGPAGGAIGGLVASALGTEATPDAVSQALQTDPEAAIKLRQMELDHAKEMRSMLIQAETNHLAEVNATIRAEYQQEDKFVKRWRPTLGYAVTLSWTLTWFAVCYVIVFDTSKATAVVNALSATAVMWSVALTLLGVSVNKRSQDKQVSAGQTPSTLVGGIIGAIKNN